MLELCGGEERLGLDLELRKTRQDADGTRGSFDKGFILNVQTKKSAVDYKRLEH